MCRTSNTLFLSYGGSASRIDREFRTSPIGATFFMMPEIRGGNWIEGMLEKASITRRAYEAIAELHGLDLDHDLSLIHISEPTRPY